MPSLSLLLAWIATNALGVLIPGPDLILILNQSLTRGTRFAVAAAAGIATGLLAHLFLVGALLTASAETSATVFQVIRIFGGGYLVWVGVGMILNALHKPQAGSTAVPSEDLQAHQSVSLAASYRAGLLINLSNVKAALWFFSLMPGFVDLSRPIASQVAILAGTMVLLAFVEFSMVAAVAGRFRSFLTNHPTVFRWQEGVAGLLFAAVGATFAFVSISPADLQSQPAAQHDTHQLQEEE